MELGNHLPLMESLVNDQIAFFLGHEIIGLSSKYNVTFIPLFQTHEAYFVNPVPKLIESHKQKLNERTVYEVDSLLASIDMALDTNAIMPYPDAMTDYLKRFGLKALSMDTPPFRGTVGIYHLAQEMSVEHLNLLQNIKKLASERFN